MFLKSNYILHLAPGAATQTKPVRTGLKLVVYAGRLCLCSSGFNRRILLKHPLSPDGNKIVSTSEDKTLIVWNLERILSQDSLAHGCNWVRDYLKNNSNVSLSERDMCDGVGIN